MEYLNYIKKEKSNFIPINKLKEIYNLHKEALKCILSSIHRKHTYGNIDILMVNTS